MRGILLAWSAAALVGLTSPLHAQYPYPPMPYGPVPYGPMPAYGYPPPLPPYGNPYVQPVQFAPRGPSQPPAPRVYDFGALPDENANSTIIMMPNSTATSTVVPTTPTSVGVSTSKKPAPRNTLVGLWKNRHHDEPKQEGGGPSGCGPNGCGPAGCGPAGCGPAPCDVCQPPLSRPLPRPHPRGHCFFEAGAYFLVPSPSNRNAYAIRTGGEERIVDFPQDVYYAPRFTFGCVCHNGWGVRADYWFTQGNTNTSASNSVPTDFLTTPTGLPFQISSPGATLAAGVGSDQFTFTQAFEMQIGALDLIHESTCFDMTFITGIGARYGQITQRYSATRINAGGVGTDREDLNFQSRFEGIGPTISIDSVCPVYKSCLSLYSAARGTALFGIERFRQDYSLQRDATVPGVTAANVTTSSQTSEHRTVYAVEIEAGIQIGKRIGPCYWFSRTGVAVQRWWDVGTPLGNRGDLSFIGGTFTLGVTY